MSSSIFISYDATSDAGLAHRLAKDLVAVDRTVWIAPESILPGESFPAAIDRGLNSACVFLLVVTPAALGSAWVKAEVDAAIDLEKKRRLRFIPLIIEETPLTPLLSCYQTLKITDDYDASFRLILQVLGMVDTSGAGAKTAPAAVDSSGRFKIDIPKGTFIQDVLQALQFGAKHYDYLAHLVAQQGSSILAVAERELLRIGVVISENDQEDKELILSRITQELMVNPHKVSGIIGIQQSERTSMQTYEVVGHEPTLRIWKDDSANGSKPPRIVHLRWRAIDGDHAVTQALDIFFKLLRSRKWLDRLETDAYVEDALSAMSRSAQFLNIKTAPPDINSRSVVRVLLDPEGIRIGVAVWTSQHVDPNDVRADISRELHSNPHNISSLIGIYASKETSIQPWDVLDTGEPAGFVFAWNRKAVPTLCAGAWSESLSHWIGRLVATTRSPLRFIMAGRRIP